MPEGTIALSDVTSSTSGTVWVAMFIGVVVRAEPHFGTAEVRGDQVRPRDHHHVAPAMHKPA